MKKTFEECVVADLRMLADRSYQNRLMVYILISFIMFQSFFIGYLLYKVG